MNIAEAPSPPLSVSRFNALNIAVVFLTVTTLFRLWYSTQLGLVPDETYYWLWSKHLAASYTDKGPVIAWLIAAGTWLFGDTQFGIRWIGVLLSAGTSWQMFRLGRRLYDDRLGLLCLALTLVIPLFAVGAIIMTIDSPSVFCWAWAINVFWTALETGKTRHWIGLGLVIGLGFLAKFTNGVQLGCIALFLLWSAPHRRFLFSRQSLALVIVFTLCSLPIIYWNSQVGWLQADALHSRSGVQSSFHVRPSQFFRFAGESLGVISPLIGIGMLVAAIGLLVSRRRDPRVQFLLCQFVPLYALFSFFSLNSAGKSNWPAPGLIAGIVLLVVFWQDLVQRRPGWRHAVYAALGIALLMTLVLHAAVLVPLPATTRIMRRTQGWPDYAAHIERARTKFNTSLLIANHYSQASMAQFYLPGHPTVFLPTGWHPQFKLWGDYPLAADTRALFITNDIWDSADAIGSPLTAQFKTRQLVDDFWTQHQGRNMTRFQIYLLTRD
ncbi:MAG: 4-amino-4-deoxy-L-arabinose transferase [Pedosphaera sp.]|nr:4-amino-4-deoxy-L-arabinose transferase [Pedosphaera sp.]